MSREILFKAKRRDNHEWIIGYYCKYGDNHCIIEPTECGIAKGVGILPETLCEYTNLRDKNGNRIWENDIVRTQPFSDRPYSSKAKFKEHIGVVEYHISHFKNSLYEQDYEAGWQVNVKDYGKYACYDWSEFFKCEVIGNRFDHDELLAAER